uniref:BTB domain-containing protein n=1 Tax=Globodera rostochiensis TaxID=31243 RepID=A0A914I9Z0_GLORO
MLVDEKSITDIAIQKFIEITAFAKIEFTFDNQTHHLLIKHVAPHSSAAEETGPLAQIVVWKWVAGTQDLILDKGGSISFECIASSVIIRILKKRPVIENPCLPLSSPGDDFTVHIGIRQVTLSASWLMTVSPMFERMLTTKMKESVERKVTLDDIVPGFTMEQFELFLGYICRNNWRERLPDPTTVVGLVPVADYFQIGWLKERCDAHLVNAVEIPLADRLLLAERFNLSKLQTFFLQSVSVVDLKKIVKPTLPRLSPPTFLTDLTDRLCDEE